MQAIANFLGGVASGAAQRVKNFAVSGEWKLNEVASNAHNSEHTSLGIDHVTHSEDRAHNSMSGGAEPHASAPEAEGTAKESAIEEHVVDSPKIDFAKLTDEQKTALKNLIPRGQKGEGTKGDQGPKGDAKGAIGWGVGTAAATSLVGLGGLLWAQSSANKTQDKKLALLANQIQQSQQQ